MTSPSMFVQSTGVLSMGVPFVRALSTRIRPLALPSR